MRYSHQFCFAIIGCGDRPGRGPSDAGSITVDAGQVSIDSSATSTALRVWTPRRHLPKTPVSRLWTLVSRLCPTQVR